MKCILCDEEITQFDLDHGRTTVAGDREVVDDPGAVLHLECYQQERIRMKKDPGILRAKVYAVK